MYFTRSIYIDGKEFPYELDHDSGKDTMRNDHRNGIQRIFIMGHDCKGRYCRVGSIALPLAIFEHGGICVKNGKEYRMNRMWGQK